MDLNGADTFSAGVQLEEDLSPHLRWSMAIKTILNAGKSEFQAYELVDTYSFGKV